MQFFIWVAENWQAVCAWAGGLYLTYHICRLFAVVVLAINSISARFKNAEDTLVLLSTNHLPHLQKQMEEGTRVLEEIRDDLKKVLKIEDEI